MTREEILEKSQNENKGMNLAEIETSKAGVLLGWILMGVLSIVILIVDGIVFGRAPFELVFVFSASLASVFFYKFFKLRRKHELFVASAYSVSALCWLTAWIIQLADL